MRYLEKRADGSWRYQLAVPHAVRHLVGTGKRIKRHIGRMSQRDAEEIAAGHAIADKRLLRHLPTLSDEEQARIVAAGGWLRMPDREAELASVVSGHAPAQELLAPLPRGVVWRESDHWVRDEKGGRLRRVPLRPDPVPASELQLAMLGTYQRQQEQAGELAGLRALRLKKAPAAPEFSLDGLLALWKRKKAPKRTDQHERTIRELSHSIAHGIGHGTLWDYRDISVGHCRTFRDHLEHLGTSVRAVENHLYALRGMFSAAVEEGTITANPAETVRPNGRHIETDREAFTGAELRMILNKAEAVRLGGDRHEATMWAIRLAIWTGARPREIMQLTKANVVAANGGPAHIHITEGHREQSVKSGFARKVPLAPEVEGFVEWAHRQPGEFVFGCFPFNAQKGRAGWTGDTFMPFLRDVVGITSPLKVFYSFRHRFTDLLERGGVPEIRQHALVGHGSKSVHRKYKTDPKLRELYLDVIGLKPFED